MDDEVRVAPDRRGEVAVRGAREPRVPEVLRVVARLLERAQHERGKRLLATFGVRDVLAHALARLGRDPRRLLRRHVVGVGRRRSRDLDRRQLREQPRDRERLRPLVHAEERFAATPGQQAGHGLVREDHQLFDQRVRVRLGLEPRLLDAPVAVERERDLGTGDPKRTARESPPPELERDRLCEPQPLGEVVRRVLAPCEDRFGLPVRQSLVRADHRPVERRLAGLQRAVEQHLDRDAQPVDVGPERARVVRELVRKHRSDEARDIDGQRAVCGPSIERRPRRHEPRHVGDVDPDADPVAFAPRGDRVVEVLRGLGVDRERQQLA